MKQQIKDLEKRLKQSEMMNADWKRRYDNLMELNKNVTASYDKDIAIITHFEKALNQIAMGTTTAKEYEEWATKALEEVEKVWGVK